MKQYSALIGLMLWATIGWSQTILMEEDVNEDTLVANWGPNRANHMYGITGVGFVASETEGAGGDIKYGNSSQFIFGYVYKRKLAEWYSVGLGMGVTRTWYRLEQDSSKILPDTLLHDKERLVLDNFYGEVYNRLSFGKRGDYMGTYLDFGLYGSYKMGAKHTFRDEHHPPLPSGATTTKVTNKGMDYLNTLNHGIMVRFGGEFFALYGRYRLSDVFNNKGAHYPELPRLIIGLHINTPSY